MEAPGSGFAPLYRSDQQLTLLCFLFVLMPGGHMKMTQLAAATDTSASTVSREVARLETAGIVVVETIGRAKLVGANWASPIARPLHMMLSQMCGPLRELVALYGVPGVVSVFVFGSWAERYVGIPGPYPNDVDVLIIGDKVDQLSIQMACSRASRELHKLTGGALLDINPVVLTVQEWANDTDPSPFIERIRIGELVDVALPATNVTNAAHPVGAGQQ